MGSVDRGSGERAFGVANICVLLMLAATVLLPIVHILAGSFSFDHEISRRGFFLLPDRVTLDNYRYMLSTDQFARSLLTTVGVTVVGTLFQVTVTLMFAYPLSRESLPGRKLVMRLVVFTMVFSGGMIPLFLVVKQLGLLNHYASLILPLAISPFNLILAKNFFQELPDELMEAAKLDGCGEFDVFRRIVLPLSKPIIATISLFHAVGLWNDYMSPLLYINDSSKWTLQVFVRQITSQANVIVNPDPNQVPPGQGIKFAVIIAAMVPVTLVYPFLQKHFAKGVMIGAVKG